MFFNVPLTFFCISDDEYYLLYNSETKGHRKLLIHCLVLLQTIKMYFQVFC